MKIKILALSVLTGALSVGHMAEADPISKADLVKMLSLHSSWEGPMSNAEYTAIMADLKGKMPGKGYDWRKVLKASSSTGEIPDLSDVDLHKLKAPHEEPIRTEKVSLLQSMKEGFKRSYKAGFKQSYEERRKAIKKRQEERKERRRRENALREEAAKASGSSMVGDMEVKEDHDLFKKAPSVERGSLKTGLSLPAHEEMETRIPKARPLPHPAKGRHNPPLAPPARSSSFSSPRSSVDNSDSNRAGDSYAAPKKLETPPFPASATSRTSTASKAPEKSVPHKKKSLLKRTGEAVKAGMKEIKGKIKGKLNGRFRK